MDRESTERKYQDLEIELSQCCCGEPEIRVLESTFDRPREPFVLEEAQQRMLEAKVEEFEKLLITGADNARCRRKLSEEIGRALYDLLFPGAIGKTFLRSYDALRGDDGLRIRLSFGTPYDRDLGGLPWELICDPEKGRFIASAPETPVARYLDLGERIRPLKVVPPLKVLAVIACPDPATSKLYNYSKIEKDPHRLVLEEAINARKYLEVDVLEEASLPALRQKLKQAEIHGAPYHAVHFLGHGGFDEEDEGVLFFERADGSEHMVTARELARQLTDTVCLIVLASCSTGKIPVMRQGGRHAFTGVASALVAHGKSAVVAMQFAVSEQAAAAFTQAFYRLIDEERPIDEAVAEGRLAIESQGDEGALEWATPVLFLRARDGHILDLRKDVIPPKTVAIFNVLDHGKDKMEYASFTVDLRNFFDGKAIKDATAWNGAIMDDLRCKLRQKLPAGSPCHLEIAAPLSVAFAAGFLLPAKKREAITLRQRDQVWRFDGDPPAYAPFWLDEKASAQQATSKTPGFPLVEGARDIAVVADGSRSILAAVADYLGRSDLEPPTIGHLLYAGFARADQYLIKDGAHARVLAQQLVDRIDDLARRNAFPTIHFFSPGPQGLVFAIGRVCHVLPRIQLYEFDMEKKRHGSYEPSITIVPAEMDGTA